MTTTHPHPRDRLIVALDVDSVAEAERAVALLGDTVSFYKVGMQLAFSGGLDFATQLVQEGKKVFLDMKLLDIPNTMARAVEAIAARKITFTTIHAYPQAMRAAAKARGDSDLRILAVTVLTSLDDDDLAETGYRDEVAGLVAQRGRQLAEAGIDGVVASPREAGILRPLVGNRLIVTPGIRPAAAETGDQKRTATPADAISAGVDHLVVGRPVLGAPDPKSAAEEIVREIAAAAA